MSHHKTVNFQPSLSQTYNFSVITNSQTVSKSQQTVKLQGQKKSQLEYSCNDQSTKNKFTAKK